MSKRGQYTPNEMRSNVKNPTSSAYEADLRNREAQQGDTDQPKQHEAKNEDGNGKK